MKSTRPCRWTTLLIACWLVTCWIIAGAGGAAEKKPRKDTPEKLAEPEAVEKKAEETSILPAPPRAEGEGPFKRLILRGVTLINGTGAPPIGPVDIVIEQNRIVQVASV